MMSSTLTRVGALPTLFECSSNQSYGFLQFDCGPGTRFCLYSLLTIISLHCIFLRKGK